MSAPRRIQQRRTKGWRKPEGAVAVGRGTRWGNPYRVGDRIGSVDFGPAGTTIETSAQAVDLFRRRVVGSWRHDKRRAVIAELAGKDLMCWCPLDQPCHADVLLELANGAPA